MMVVRTCGKLTGDGVAIRVQRQCVTSRCRVVICHASFEHFSQGLHVRGHVFHGLHPLGDNALGVLVSDNRSAF